MAYEVMDGNTSDKTTLRAFLTKIETQYGSAKRTWVMDRGIPTEEVLAEMRGSPTPIHYLVGTPRGRLTKLEQALAAKPWEDVRESVRVKLIEQDEETYVLARSESRRDKEQGMRRRRLRKLIKRLRELQRQDLTRDELLLKLGAAKRPARQPCGAQAAPKPETVALAVKEMHFLPQETIEARFNVKGDEGVVIEAAGAVSQGMTGMGFIYTNKECLSVGIGCLVADFAKGGETPYGLLEKFKSRPGGSRDGGSSSP